MLTGRERRGIGARREVRGGVAVGPCCFWTVVAVTRRAVSSGGPRYIMLELLRRPWGLRHPARVSVDDVFRCGASRQAGANALVRSLPLFYVLSIFLYHYCYYYSYYYCYYHYYYFVQRNNGPMP